MYYYYHGIIFLYWQDNRHRKNNFAFYAVNLVQAKRQMYLESANANNLFHDCLA